MRKLYFATSKLAILAGLGVSLFVGCRPIGPIPWGTGVVWAPDPGPKHDHALFFTGSTPPDTAIYCGVERPLALDQLPAYTLYLSATASSAGLVRISFRDRPSRTFNVPVGDTFSTILNLGGVVKITAEGGVHSMMASIRVEGDYTDPFDEKEGDMQAQAQSDNFCVTAPTEPGWRSASRIIFVP